MKNVIKAISKLLQGTIRIWSRQGYINTSITCIKMLPQMKTIINLTHWSCVQWKSNGSYSESWGTPHEILNSDKKQSPIVTVWCLPLRRMLNQCKATPDTPYHKQTIHKNSMINIYQKPLNSNV